MKADMRKKDLFQKINEIRRNSNTQAQKESDLLLLWGDLVARTDKELFINQVIKRFGFFPASIYGSEEFLELLEKNNISQKIKEIADRKGKEIKNM